MKHRLTQICSILLMVTLIFTSPAYSFAAQAGAGQFFHLPLSIFHDPDFFPDILDEDAEWATGGNASGSDASGSDATPANTVKLTEGTGENDSAGIYISHFEVHLYRGQHDHPRPDSHENDLLPGEETDLLLKIGEPLTISYDLDMNYGNITAILELLEKDKDTRFCLDMDTRLGYGLSEKPIPLTLKTEGQWSADTTMGYLWLKEDGAYLTFEAEVLERQIKDWDPESPELTVIDDIFFYFGCGLKGIEDPSDRDPDNRYNMMLEGDVAFSFGYHDYEKGERKGDIRKSGEYDSNDRTAHWTITYTPAQNVKGNPEEFAYTIRDTFEDEWHTLSDASVKYQIGEDGVEVSIPVYYEATSSDAAEYDIYALVEDATVSNAQGDVHATQITFLGDLLQAGTCSNAEEPEKIIITYDTKVKDEVLLPNSGNSGGGQTLNNRAKIYKLAGEQMEPDETTKAAETQVEVPVFPWVEKGLVNVERNPGDGALLDWSVVVQTGGLVENEIHFTDTLPDTKLAFVKDSIQVYGYASSKEMENGGNGTEISVQNLLIADNTLYFAFTPEKGCSVYKIFYKTKIKEETFHKHNVEFGQNQASIEFSYNGTGYYVKDGENIGIQVNTAILTKTANPYQPENRMIRWGVHINPNRINMTGGSLTDDLGAVGRAHGCGQEGQTPFKDHTSGMSLYLPENVVNSTDGIQVSLSSPANAEITSDGDIESESGLKFFIKGNGSDPILTLRYGYDKTRQEIKKNQVLEFKVGNIGARELTVSYSTLVNDPCVYAGNILYDNREAFPFVNWVSGDVVINGHILTEVGAEATSHVFSPILKKTSGGYDYGEKAITWNVTVNESGLKEMSDVTLTDTLAAGLTYKENSLLVNGSPASPSDVTVTTDPEEENGRQTLTIHLKGPVAKNTVLTFKTLVNTAIFDFEEGKESASVVNHISMKGTAFGLSFGEKEVSADAEQRITNHNLTKHGNLLKGEGIIDYVVGINPFQLDFSDVYVRDTLDPTLLLDAGSIKLYPAVVTGNSDADGKGTPVFERQDGDATKPVDLKPTDLVLLPEGNGFTLKLPNSSDIYMLEYSADIVDYAEEYSNDIQFIGQDSDHPMNGSVHSSVGGGAGAGAGASIRKKGKLILTKTDEEGAALKGVEFSLYFWHEEDHGESGRGSQAFSRITDNNGIITFLGLNPGQMYELVEEKGLEGYEDDYTWAGDLPAGVEVSENNTLIISVPDKIDSSKPFELTLQNKRLDEGGDNPGEGGDTPGGGDNPDEGGDTPGGGDNPGEGGDTPGGGDNPGEGGDTPGGGDNPGEGGDTPGGGDNPGEGGDNSGEEDKPSGGNGGTHGGGGHSDSSTGGSSTGGSSTGGSSTGGSSHSSGVITSGSDIAGQNGPSSPADPAGQTGSIPKTGSPVPLLTGLFLLFGAVLTLMTFGKRRYGKDHEEE